MTTYFDIIMIPLQLLIVFFYHLLFYAFVLRAGLPQKGQKGL